MNKLIVTAAVVALTLAGAETFARFYLGLGEPPLTVRNAEIEYLFAPSRTYSRFANRVSYNAYSMRSDDFPSERVSDGEVRILVMGDSVVNGGSLTDQDDLATAILQRRLRNQYGIDAFVGNISAGSWGPGNLLAYAKRFGWFDADVVFIVLGSHDLADVPTFSDELGPDFPETPPMLALEEAVLRYLPRYLPILPSIGNDAPTEAQEGNHVAGARHLRDLLTEARKAVPQVLLLLHPSAEELQEGLSFAGAEILRIASDSGVPTLSVSTRMKEAASVYRRDSIRISPTAQRLYADVLFCESLAMLSEESCGE